MALTIAQIGEYVNLQALREKKELEIVTVEYIPAIDLELSKDTEIEMKLAEIEVYQEGYAKHPTGRRQYIKNIQPMKNALRILQADNEGIKIRNKAKEDTARKAYSDKLISLQTELETIQANIKTFLTGI